MGGCCSVPYPAGSTASSCLIPSPSTTSSIADDDQNPSPTTPLSPVSVLSSASPHLLHRYRLGSDLGRGEFGLTRRCLDSLTGQTLACKTISKRKLRTKTDVADVQREVEIMRTLPDHPNVVRLREAFEDREAVHLIMELCEGGELFDRIVARGHYTERAAAAIMKTIVEVVQVIDGHTKLKIQKNNLQ